MNYSSPDAKKTGSSAVFYIVGIVIIFISAFFLGRCSVKPEAVDPVVIVKTDTLVRYDTVYVPKIKWKEKIKEIKVIDTVYMPADTLLCVTQKHYEDSIASIYVSGIEPEIDSVRYFLPVKEIYVEKEIQTTKIKKSGLVINLGIYGGYGAAVKDGQVYLAPEIGIGGSIGWGWVIKTK